MYTLTHLLCVHWLAGNFSDVPVQVRFPRDSRGNEPWIVAVSCGSNHNLAVNYKRDEVRTIRERSAVLAWSLSG